MTSTVAFTPTVADYVAANRLWYARAPATRWLRRLRVAVLILALVNVVADLLLGNTLREAAWDSVALLIAAAIFAGLPLLNRALLPRQVRRMFAQRSSMADPIEVRWDAGGIAFAAWTGHSTLAWRDLYRWIVDAESFVFLASDRLMHVLPQRVLSPEQADAIVALADAGGATRVGPLPPGRAARTGAA